MRHFKAEFFLCKFSIINIIYIFFSNLGSTLHTNVQCKFPDPMIPIPMAKHTSTALFLSSIYFCRSLEGCKRTRDAYRLRIFKSMQVQIVVHGGPGSNAPSNAETKELTQHCRKEERYRQGLKIAPRLRCQFCLCVFGCPSQDAVHSYYRGKVIPRGSLELAFLSVFQIQSMKRTLPQQGLARRDLGMCAVIG